MTQGKLAMVNDLRDLPKLINPTEITNMPTKEQEEALASLTKSDAKTIISMLLGITERLVRIEQKLDHPLMVVSGEPGGVHEVPVKPEPRPQNSRKLIWEILRGQMRSGIPYHVTALVLMLNESEQPKLKTPVTENSLYGHLVGLFDAKMILRVRSGVYTLPEEEPQPEE